MRCPKVVINLFAESLRMKAIEIEEYIDENQSPLDPRQLKRLQRMNRSMKARCRRMRQAWREHDPNVDNEDADCLEELNEIVKSTKAEVAETSEKSYAVLQLHGIAQNPKRIKREQRRQEEKYLNEEKSKIREHGEKLTRQKSKDAKPSKPTWTVETNPKIQCAASTKMAEYHGGPANERWRAFENNNNALNSGREILEEIRQKRCTTKKKRGSSNSE